MQGSLLFFEDKEIGFGGSHNTSRKEITMEEELESGWGVLTCELVSSCWKGVVSSSPSHSCSWRSLWRLWMWVS